MDGARTVGVVGSPIAHSLSPVIHEAAFRELGLAWSSVRREATVAQLPEVLDWLAQPEVAGCSVTMPLKDAMVPAMDRCSETVRKLGALNCIVAEQDGTLSGHSTDGAGFLAAIEHEWELELSGQRVVVLGAGGAARAVALAAARSDAHVAILARREARALEVVEQLGTGISVATKEQVAEAEVVINATPVGMAETPSANEDPLAAPGDMKAGALACELVYHPLQTPWLAACREAGHPTMDGVGMLVHQALIAVQLWTGEEVPPEAVLATVRGSLS